MRVVLISKPYLCITEWFPNNFMKLNEDKCHFVILSTKRDTEIAIKIEEAPIKDSKEQILLGITLDQSVFFEIHVKDLGRKASQNLMLLPVYPAIWSRKS